jgi:uncharacterized protein
MRVALLALALLTGWTDSYGDGTPDQIRLRTRADQEAFRAWFRYLAESEAFAPRGVKDCSGLLRYAYRESLRVHNRAWLRESGLDALPPLTEIRAVHYPFPGLGSGLFRVRDGHPEQSFAEFADARTLMQRNAHFVSRNLAQARPGDLLFYSGPYHSMIFLGASLLDEHAGPFVVYHTGPDEKTPGEMRRPSVDQLMHHPEPRWRPVPGNPNFLGVYRWNILRDPA